jgi:O-antigen/teichoic acid export membrane protein
LVSAPAQIRGSSLLLTGRCLTIGVNVATQVLMVRYLTTLDYGALAYALAVVDFFQASITLGLRETVARFVPIYHEQRDYGKLFGTIFLVASILALTGFGVVGAFTGLPATMARLMGTAPHPHHLLAIIIFLVPLEAVDGLLMSLFASLGSPRSIFVRRYLLAPGLKLGVVLLLVTWQQDVIFLAYGYLIATTLGVLVSAWMLKRLLSHQQLLHHCQWRTMEVRAREIFAFTLPLLVSHLLSTTMQTISVVLLGYFYPMQEVGLFRVVLPMANLITTVMASFTLFYLPAAARLFAHHTHDDLNDLYRRTAIWIAVLSFPVFAVTFALAQPLVSWLYGARYESSGVILTVLSVGHYLSVALGFNALTLKALGKLRALLLIDVVAVGANVAFNLLLIPRHGALGAAIGVTGAMILRDVLRQVGVYRVLGLNIFVRPYGVFYLTLAWSTCVLFLIQFWATPNYVAFPLVGLVSVGVLLLSRRHLRVAATFPELSRLPLLRLLFA